MARGGQVQLFVSYARADKIVADALVADAVSLGHQTFYDRDLTGGQRWWDALLDQIQLAQVFVPVLSDDYRGSEACRAEASWAKAWGIPFLPVRTNEQAPGLYDPVIAEANWIAYDPQSRGSLAELARGLAATAPVVPPTTPPARPEVPVTYLNTLEQRIRGVSEISRGDQLALVSDLRAKLHTRDEAVARTLLGSLRARPEITFEVATAIDLLLGIQPAPPAPEAPSSATEPQDVLPIETSPSRDFDRPKPEQPTFAQTPAQTPALGPPTPRPVPVAAANSAYPRLPRPAASVLVGVATLMWIVAVGVLPWAPYRIDNGFPVRRPRLWESASIVPPEYAVLAVIVAVVVTGMAVLAMFVRLPVAVRAAIAAVGVLVGIVAAARTSTASLAVSGGSGMWLYLGAMLTLAVTLVFTTP